MATNKTPEQIKEEHIDKMGRELGLVFNFLYHDLIWLHTKFYTFNNLYGKGKQRVDLLNKSDSLFFFMIQKTLWDDILLHIGRLTDPKKSVGRSNISINTLTMNIRNEKLTNIVKSLIEETNNAAKFFRERRNKKIAHNDLPQAIDEKAEPLSPTSILQVKTFLIKCAELFNEITKHYLDSTVVYDIDAFSGFANSLLNYLALGNQFENERLDRIRNGKSTPADYEDPDY